jgi:hypothetical protein
LADGYLALQLLGADAEKLAGRELACLAPDGSTSAVLADLAAVPLLAAALQLVLEELGKPGAGPFAAQSCVVQAAADERTVSARQHAELGQWHWNWHLAALKLVARYWQPQPKVCARPEELLALHLQVVERTEQAVLAQSELRPAVAQRLQVHWVRPALLQAQPAWLPALVALRDAVAAHLELALCPAASPRSPSKHLQAWRCETGRS